MEELGRIALRKPRFWSGRFLRISTGFVLGGVISAAMGRIRGDDGTQAPTVPLLALLAGAWGVLATLRLLRLTRRAPHILFYPDHVELPNSAESRGSTPVAYGEILSLASAGPHQARQIVIATSRRAFSYPEAAFSDPHGATVLHQALAHRLATLENASDLRADFARRKAVEDATRGRPVRVTHTLLGLLVATYYLQGILVPGDRPFGLVRMGANAALLVRDGQWFRLVSGNFLHASLPHIALNGLAILALGTLLERLLGPTRLLVIYLTSALAGSAASTVVLRHGQSVGASTAVFGLLVALALCNRRYYRELPLGLRQPARVWVIVLGLNALLPLLFFGLEVLFRVRLPKIDWAAHAGGAAAGAICVLLMLRRRTLAEVLEPPGSIARTFAIALTALFVAGLVAAGVRGVTAGAEDEARVREATIASILQGEL